MASLPLDGPFLARPMLARVRSAPVEEKPFYFNDSQVVLKAKQQIYKVHRYFLVRESEFFQDLFSLPQGESASVEGVDDEHPIYVPGTPINEFENLLRFFYFGMHDDYKPTVADWISMLSISTRLNFPKVRERAIKEITARMEEIDPFDLIGIAVKYDVQQWLMPAYRRIVTRTNLIAHEEAKEIPFPMAVMLMRSREQYWRDYNSRLLNTASRHSYPIPINTPIPRNTPIPINPPTPLDPRSAADYIIDPEVRLMDQVSREPAVPVNEAMSSDMVYENNYSNSSRDHADINEDGFHQSVEPEARKLGGEEELPN
ncbi:hypothetical protein EDB86DRAFT_546908 [Lactarius hatsudake]|nr:hypothetical protein EDB86DRAFT_546908 [Lactarius hatsudake]